jgi:hypothetical protein
LAFAKIGRRADVSDGPYVVLVTRRERLVQPVGDQRYRPHVSVAYISADGPALPYIHATADIHTDAVRLRLRHLDLELNRDHRMYEWNTIARLPLG